jgi:hypothetical protein
MSTQHDLFIYDKKPLKSAILAHNVSGAPGTLHNIMGRGLTIP